MTRSLVAYDNGIPSLRFTPVDISTCILCIFTTPLDYLFLKKKIGGIFVGVATAVGLGLLLFFASRPTCTKQTMEQRQTR
ncbi:hypothetical protein J3E72DRAFT_347628 [Bipolaris maydis]|uniref:uncharacterized protein n=1 Tax=Cochliobolus heterostrophus TaxID=5016 RepID=UPI0024D558DE|nr:hypothetical protein J3E73DRAFT_323832 [Bipolaris maydis]KAJ5057154.1 hypothetical protein J3E74DRAFT_370072 [Bipolaris maydis]KAJ6194316.1 hypothetical protein J3E72DRAFT_347628 [Bipolaris maydis]KAJ6212643.1 hypothetical protein PSV09DRAFT_2289268 [Bipolaris maydis]KAJ6266069.1 hypothetical protein PSV08DRAFT_334849 [Bipolaris maydis]